ncbi:MAG: hypothetical protein IB618_01535 [Candidatus Pacearchaeota archaeon]|nr:MAG: hypothetical protein IB618_01535 [Candidatus Pacearchaeota archaeon]
MVVGQIILYLATSGQPSMPVIIDKPRTRALEFYANPSTDSVQALQGDTSKLWIPGYPDYTQGTFNEEGKSHLPYGQWQIHQPRPGDTLNYLAKANRDGKIYQTIAKIPFDNEEFIRAWEVFLNNPNDSLPVHAANIGKIINKMGTTDSLVRVISYNFKNPSLKDTSELNVNLGNHFYHAFNAENIDPQPEGSIRSEFTLGPVMQYLDWTVDKALGDAQLIADSLVFELTGVKEDLENRVKEPFSLVKGNITTDIVRLNRKVDKVHLFDVYGRKVKTLRSTDKIGMNGLNQGVYFVCPESEGLITKPEKVIFVR